MVYLSIYVKFDEIIKKLGGRNYLRIDMHLQPFSQHIFVLLLLFMLLCYSFVASTDNSLNTHIVHWRSFAVFTRICNTISSEYYPLRLKVSFLTFTSWWIVKKPSLINCIRRDSSNTNVNYKLCNFFWDELFRYLCRLNKHTSNLLRMNTFLFSATVSQFHIANLAAWILFGTNENGLYYIFRFRNFWVL